MHCILVNVHYSIEEENLSILGKIFWKILEVEKIWGQHPVKKNVRSVIVLLKDVSLGMFVGTKNHGNTTLKPILKGKD